MGLELCPTHADILLVKVCHPLMNEEEYSQDINYEKMSWDNGGSIPN